MESEQCRTQISKIVHPSNFLQNSRFQVNYKKSHMDLKTEKLLKKEENFCED